MRLLWAAIERLSRLWCRHDWWRRTSRGLIYLHCVKCGKTSPGWVVDQLLKAPQDGKGARDGEGR